MVLVIVDLAVGSYEWRAFPSLLVVDDAGRRYLHEAVLIATNHDRRLKCGGLGGDY